MIRLRRAVAGLVVLSCAGVTASGAQPTQVAPPTFSGGRHHEPVRLAAPARPVKSGSTSVYIVKLKEPGAASYGNASIYSAEQARARRARTPRAARAAVYAQRLEQIARPAARRRRRTVCEALQLPLRVERLRGEAQRGRSVAARAASEVERIWLDTDQHLDTNNSSTFLGLENQSGGLHADLKLARREHRRRRDR